MRLAFDDLDGGTHVDASRADFAVDYVDRPEATITGYRMSAEGSFESLFMGIEASWEKPDARGGSMVWRATATTWINPP